MVLLQERNSGLLFSRSDIAEQIMFNLSAVNLVQLDYILHLI